jgi:hypothetical protein
MSRAMGLSALSPARRMSDLPRRLLASGFAAGTRRTGLALLFFFAGFAAARRFFALRFLAGLDGFFFFAMTTLLASAWSETLKKAAVSGKLAPWTRVPRRC